MPSMMHALSCFSRIANAFGLASGLYTITMQALYIHACLLIQTSHSFVSKDVIHDLRRQKSSSQSSNSCSNCHACSTTPLLTAVLLLTVRLGIHWLLVGLLGISTLVCRLICWLICRLLIPM